VNKNVEAVTDRPLPEIRTKKQLGASNGL